MKRGGPLARRTQLNRTRFRHTRPEEGSRREIIQLLDAEVRRIVHGRDRVCVTCGGNDKLEVSHYYRRGHMMLRWDLRNVALQCQHENQSHPMSKAYHTYMQTKYLPSTLNELEHLANDQGKLDDTQLQDLLMELCFQ